MLHLIGLYILINWILALVYLATVLSFRSERKRALSSFLNIRENTEMGTFELVLGVIFVVSLFMASMTISYLYRKGIENK